MFQVGTKQSNQSSPQRRKAAGAAGEADGEVVQLSSLAVRDVGILLQNWDLAEFIDPFAEQRVNGLSVAYNLPWPFAARSSVPAKDT